jgi:hypothetical protein
MAARGEWRHYSKAHAQLALQRSSNISCCQGRAPAATPSTHHPRAAGLCFTSTCSTCIFASLMQSGPKASLYLTLVGILAGFMSTFWNLGYQRTSARMQVTRPQLFGGLGGAVEGLRFIDVCWGGGKVAVCMQKRHWGECAHEGISVCRMARLAVLACLCLCVPMLCCSA